MNVSAIESLRHRAYHLTTVQNYEGMVKCGELLARSRLSQFDFRDVADPAILMSRHECQIPAGLRAHDYVPLVFDVVQPMFVRLVALGLVALDEIIAIEFRLEDVISLGATSTIYSHNLADPLTKQVAMDDLDKLIDRVKMSTWYDVVDAELRELSMRQRQSEILVPGSISIDLICRTISMGSGGDPSAREFRRAAAIASRRDGW